MSRASELVCAGAVVSSADGFGAGKGVLKREGTACAKALGVCRALAKGQCASVERVEG